jgi:hypothetical protein
MHTPQLQPEHQRLAQLAGSWIGRETIQPSAWSPKGGTARCAFDARLVAGGFFLVSDYVHEEGTTGMNLRAHAVTGWDPERRAYVQHWFDAFGRDEGRGVWEGDTLTFEFANHRTRYTLDGAGFGFEVEARRPAEGATPGWSRLQEGAYRRSSP